jgi:hypothetical protein
MNKVYLRETGVAIQLCTVDNVSRRLWHAPKRGQRYIALFAVAHSCINWRHFATIVGRGKALNTVLDVDGFTLHVRQARVLALHACSCRR